MYKRRTDLAMEAHELWKESAGETTRLEGVEARDTRREGFQVATVKVLNAEGAAALDKPVGTYVTLVLDGLLRREDDAFPRAARALAAELRALLPAAPGEEVLVVGLGNRAITPDAVGPLAADHTLVTRHLVDRVPEHFGAFRPVSAIAAGVLASTGMESGELVAALVEKTRPACVIAIDALASRSLRRVCRTVQLADTGIVPGSGVGNARMGLNRESLGVPVVAVGVPTVVDAATLCADVLSEAGMAELDPAALSGAGEGVIVTPREIDSQVADLAKVLGFGITLALQEGLSPEEAQALLGW